MPGTAGDNPLYRRGRAWVMHVVQHIGRSCKKVIEVPTGFWCGVVRCGAPPYHILSVRYYRPGKTQKSHRGSCASTRFSAVLVVASLVLCTALVSAQASVRPTVAPGTTFTKCNEAGAERIWHAISSNQTVNVKASTTVVNWIEILRVSTMPYTDVLGTVAFAILFAIPFVLMALRQQNSLIPALCGCVLGTFLLTLMPPEYRVVGVTFIALAVVAAVYGLFRGR